LAELSRQVGISEQTPYRQFKQLQEENGRLKRFGGGADVGQGDAAGRIGKKTVTPSQRRPVVSYWHDAYRVSERRACRVSRLSVSNFRYESVQEPRMALRLRTSGDRSNSDFVTATGNSGRC
jgi:hypothetical protein